MLKIVIPASEAFDEEKNEFITSKATTIQVEHSLVSLSKWESKWHKPFLSKGEKTLEETIDYIRCMTITQNVDPNIYVFITEENINKIKEYIDEKMTATTFANPKQAINKSIITAEIIFYWMITFNIPFECQKWHLNRLLTLINVCSAKSQPPGKMSKKEIMSRNAALNAARRQATGSKG
jgi:hypothetical protein